MIHPACVLREISPELGRGLVAAAPIACGTIVWCRDALDLTLDPTRARALPPMLRTAVETWGYREASGQWVLCWDEGRFMNHSCAPNVRGVGRWIQIAVREIAVGQQITCDYAECNLVRPLICACGASTCRGVVEPGVLDAAWSEEVEAALRVGGALVQPLREVTLGGEEVDAWLSGHGRPPSPASLLAIDPVSR